MGHVTSKDGLKPGRDKIKAFREMPTPKKHKRNFDFFLCVNYLLPFIQISLNSLSHYADSHRNKMSKNNSKKYSKPLSKSSQKDPPWHILTKTSQSFSKQTPANMV